ncbi:MAG: fused MFS/spermidine synthase [Desulfobacterales bacterium]|nr:fused MFS/spermidine synthase [Desulfobacterales bacterium]
MNDRTKSSSYDSRLSDVNSKMLSMFVAGCFFISGAAGLVYEVIWVRMIDKVIGSAPFAVASVLSVFMAGLALGGYLAGRTIDRFTSRSALLALYGKLEIGIGIFALAVPFIIQATQPIYRSFYDRLLDHFWCYQSAAFVGCVLIVIVPTSLMGATLPVLCRFYVRGLEHIGTRTGWLYGLNTVGAAIGVVLCGFVLIKILGVWMTLVLFAGLNGLVGMSCLILSRYAAAEGMQPRRQKEKLKVKTDVAPERPSIPCKPRRQMRWALIIFAVSGFCAMAYEVLWTRLLGLVAGPTTYCFTLVVATFIIGLALGSIFFGRVADKARNVFPWLAVTQIGAAVTALVVSQMLGNSQFFFAKLIHMNQGRFSNLILNQSMVLFIILLTPTFFLGGAFPLVNRLYIQSMAGMGRLLGTAYALNTLGAIIGSLVAGFILIPWLGKENGLRLIILIQITIAGLSLMHTGFGWGRKAIERFIVIGLLFVGYLLLAHYPSWRLDLLSRGWYRDFGAIEQDLDRIGWAEAIWNGSKRIAGKRQGLEVVFQGEGVAGFTTVEKEITSLGTVEYALFNSGKADASSHGDRSTQALSAHIPLLFHPGAQNVMVLGLASGMTAGEVLLYPVQKLDIVEINQQVVDACRYFFYPWNNACLQDPRIRLIVQDGRNHLTLTHECYDVIISEPSNPWMAGLANLYSLEFFQMVRQRLSADGIFAQWIQSYEMDWETFSLLGRTFTAVFSKNALVKIGPVDYLMLGFNNDNKGFDWLNAKKNYPFACKSKIVYFPGVNFLVHLILTEDLRSLFGPGRLHTDNKPYLEFSAPLKLYKDGLNIDSIVAGCRRLSPETQRVLDANCDVEPLLDMVEFAASANVPMFNVLPWSHLSSEHKIRYKRAVMDYCSRELVPSYNIFSDFDLKACCAGIHIDAIRKKLSDNDSFPIDHYNLALALIAAGKKSEAVQSLRKAITLDTTYEAAVTALGLLLAETGELDEAASLLTNAVALSPRKADPYKFLGMVELRRGAADTAVTNLSTALALAPDDPIVMSELGVAFMRQGKTREAISYLTKALENDPQDSESRYYLELAKKQADGDGK